MRWGQEYVSRLEFKHDALRALNVRYVIVSHEEGDFSVTAETLQGTEAIRPNSGSRWPSAETAEAAVAKHRGKILAGVAKALEDARS